MTAVVEQEAPVLELDNPAGPRPRPAAPGLTRAPEIVTVASGIWAVCVFDLIPKNGFGHLDFPHYWGRRGDGSMWRVARHGEVPNGTFVFTSEADAQAVLAEAFGAATDLRPFMSVISVPSDDRRMRAASRRAPRQARRTTGSNLSGVDRG